MAYDREARLLAPLVADPPRAGVFCDFDGTLAAIVDDPALAAPLRPAVDALDRLTRSFARVAIVSGRPLAFLESHLGGRGLILSGLYGLETQREGRVVADAAADGWRSVVDEVARRGGATLSDRLLVEAKGLSVAVHFRTAPDLAEAARDWARGEAERTGLIVHEGRMSYELRPPVDGSKGSAVAALAEGLAAACFVGDDVGDLPAFDALDQLADAGAHVVRVAVASPEAPPELLHRADLVVDGPEGVLRLLNRLAG